MGQAQPDKTVYVVHSVDTEGPLYESIQATFDRLRELFNLELGPSYRTLEQLRNRELVLGEQEEAVARVVSPENLTYNDSWDKIDAMLARIMSRPFRDEMPDADGNGWVYTWHCLDHVEYEVNPRRRDIGYHNIHDRYLEFLDKFDSPMDEIQWHFHPMSTYREAHRCATSYENSTHLHQVLARRVIERNFFPSVFRAGFQTERPDSNWFLEQWIPFDISNMAMEDNSELDQYADFKNGRSGDWRRAPHDWSIYHPDLYDYQQEGSLKRYIARCLNIQSRIGCLTQREVHRAFEKARQGEPVLMGVCSHDFRDMTPEVDRVRAFLHDARERYPDVQFRYARARDAFNQVVYGGHTEPLQLDMELYREDGMLRLRVQTREGTVFGPQPYLALKTRGGRFIHDNFDFAGDGRTWHYAFDAETVREDDLDTVGVAANNVYGQTCVKTLRVND